MRGTKRGKTISAPPATQQSSRASYGTTAFSVLGRPRQTMPALEAKRARMIFVLMGAFILCGIIALLIVPLFGPCWHLLHGDTTSYAGWKIPVPKGFYVRKSPNGATMWRLSLGVPLLPVPYGHVSIFEHQGESFLFSPHYRGFSDSVSQDAATGGYAIQERAVSTAGSTAYCLELDRRAGQPTSMARCAIEGTGIAVFYEGDKKYLSDFFSVLRNMSKMP